MKTIPVSFIVAGMLLPTLCLAEPETPSGSPEHKKNSRPAAHRPLLEAWELVDVDQDDFISKAEFDLIPRIQKLPLKMRDGLFARLDDDGDGRVARRELAKMKKNHDGQDDSSLKRFWELDADRSGSVDFDEFKEGALLKKLPADKQKNVFDRLDTNEDGVISPKDKPQFPHSRPNLKDQSDAQGKNGDRADLHRKLDANKDGAVSFDEFRMGPAVKDLSEDEQEDRFEALDKNGDGIISKDDKPPSAPSE